MFKLFILNQWAPQIRITCDNPLILIERRATDTFYP